MAAMTGKGFRPKRKAAVKGPAQADTSKAAAAPPLPAPAATGGNAELERLSSKPAPAFQATAESGRALFRPAQAERVEGGAQADYKAEWASSWRGSARPASQAEGAGERQQAAQQGFPAAWTGGQAAHGPQQQAEGQQAARPDAHAAGTAGEQQALHPQHQAEGRREGAKPSFPFEVTGGQHAPHPHHQQALSTGGQQGLGQAASRAGAIAGQRGHFSQPRTWAQGVARFQQVPALDRWQLSLLWACLS